MSYAEMEGFTSQPRSESASSPVCAAVVIRFEQKVWYRRLLGLIAACWRSRQVSSRA